MAQAQKVIKADKSVIIACDVTSFSDYRDIIKQTHNVKGIGGYKPSQALVEKSGLIVLSGVLRGYTDKPLIHDPQKGCTDLPHTQNNRVMAAKESGVSAIIGYPFSGQKPSRHL